MRHDATRDTRAPTAEDFTSTAVMRKVMSHAVQHPLTIFPLVISAAAGLAAILFSSASALAVSLGFFALAGGSWSYQYFLKGETLAYDHIRELRRNWEQNRREQMNVFEEKCRDREFFEGAKEAIELRGAYEKLRSFLEEKAHGGDNLSAQRYLVLATESYERGLRFLEQALATFTVVEDIDERKLVAEIKRLEKKRQGAESAEEKTAVTVQIEAQQRRIDLRKDRAREIEQLLARCEGEETALEVAYLELVELFQTHGDALFSKEKGARTSELERAVASARRIEEKLRGMVDTSADDAIYSKE